MMNPRATGGGLNYVRISLGAMLFSALAAAPLAAATIGPGGDFVVLNPLAISGNVPSLDVYRIPLSLSAGTYEVAHFSFHNATLAASPGSPGSVRPFLAILTDPGTDTLGPSRAYESIWAGPAAAVTNVPDIDDIGNAENIVTIAYLAGSQSFTLTADTQLYAGVYSLGTGRVAYRPTLGEMPHARVDHDLEFTPVTSPGQAIGEFSTRFMTRIYAFELEIIPSDGQTPVAGDFNGDRNVDGADFVVWQTNFPSVGGKTLASGDANGDGAVDGADFVIWQTNFPTVLGGSAVAVPEPSGAVTLALAALAAVGVGTGGAVRRRLDRAAA